MPTYDMLCPQCAYRGEHFYQTFAGYEADPRTCPKCDKGRLERIITSCNLNTSHTDGGHIVQEHVEPALHIHLTPQGAYARQTFAIHRSVRKDPRRN